MGEQGIDCLVESQWLVLLGRWEMKQLSHILLAIILATSFCGCAMMQFSKFNDDVPVKSELTERQREDLDIQFGLTRIIERKGETEEAKKSYKKIVDADPSYSAALHRLGVVAAQQEELELAIGYLKSAVELEPESASMLGDLGYVYLLDSQFESAEKYLAQAFELDSNDPRITNNLALAMGYQRKIKRAIRMFRRSNPESQALANIGYIYSQLGELEQARRYFHAALDIDSTVQQAALGLLEIDKLSQGSDMQTEPISESELLKSQLLESQPLEVSVTSPEKS